MQKKQATSIHLAINSTCYSFAKNLGENEKKETVGGNGSRDNGSKKSGIPEVKK
jgi:hypothetical protein